VNQNGEFERCGPRHSNELTADDGRHGARGSGEDGGEDLTEADPDCLRQAHVFHLPGVNAASGRAGTSFFRLGIQGVDQPHHDPADQQRPAHDHNIFQVLANHLGEQEGRNRCDYERNGGETKGMSESGTPSAITARKRRKKPLDASPEIDGQAEDGTEFDDDGIHLPVTIGEADVEQQFGETQVRGGTDREELGEAFDNAKDQRQQVIVQSSSGESMKQYRRKKISQTLRFGHGGEDARRTAAAALLLRGYYVCGTNRRRYRRWERLAGRRKSAFVRAGT